MTSRRSSWLRRIKKNGFQSWYTSMQKSSTAVTDIPSSGVSSIKDIDYTDISGIHSLDDTVLFKKGNSGGYAVPPVATPFSVTSGTYYATNNIDGNEVFYTNITSSSYEPSASDLFRVTVVPGETIHFLTVGAGASIAAYTGTSWGQSDYGAAGSTAVGSFVVPAGVTTLTVCQGERGKHIDIGSTIAYYSSFPGGGGSGRTSLSGGSGGYAAATGAGYTGVWTGTANAPTTSTVVFVMGGAGGSGEYPGTSAAPITQRPDGGRLARTSIADGYTGAGGVNTSVITTLAQGGTYNSGGAASSFSGTSSWRLENQTSGSFLQGGSGESGRYDIGPGGGGGWYGGGGGGAGGGPGNSSGGGGSSWHNTFVNVENTYSPGSVSSYTTRSESQLNAAQNYMTNNHFTFTIPTGCRGFGGKANYSTPATPYSEHGFVMLWRT